MDIYWIKDKSKCGPSTVPDVISLVQMGELTPDSLGWHAGCPRWMPLRELPALADFLHDSPAAPEPDNAPGPEAEDEDAPQAETPDVVNDAQEAGSREGDAHDDTPDGKDEPIRVYLPSPAARLFARLLDSMFYAVLLYGALYLEQVPYDRALIPTDNPLLWLPMVLLEAFMIANWGTTPGKAFMGIRVCTIPENARPRFMRALGRSIIVFTLGMGMMYFPLLMPIMMLLSYWRLRRFGITSWDARCSTLAAQQKPATPSRFVLAFVSLYVCFILLGACIRPWVLPLLDDVAKESPEAAATLRRMMPAEILYPEAPPAPQPVQPAAQPAEPAEQGPPKLNI